ncbi:hypothetical protein N9922_02800 [Cyclobacteriaceae bacterium]|nr:hypothetical protein [Cyclobacteriaceae bacterium]MDB4291122.1 hypothetical protein [Cyclobacteriaceae bacterium]MDC6483892.1 hypothetical protein [Cyclobacteriaceae bacterium]
MFDTLAGRYQKFGQAPYTVGIVVPLAFRKACPSALRISGSKLNDGCTLSPMK